MLKLWNKKSGQGLVELAILGVILVAIIAYLFQLGINFNRYQDLNMRASRNARAMAYNPAYRDHSRQVTLTMTEDKPTMNFSTSSLQQTYTPYTANAASVWSDKLYWDYDPSTEDLEHVIGSMLDLPAQNFLVNGTFITLPTGTYSEKLCLAFVDGGWEKQDAYPLGILEEEFPIEEGCIRSNPMQSWCWKWKRAGKIKQGDMIDIDTIPDGKEELILRKVDANDTTLIELLETLGILVPDLGGLGSWFLILDYKGGALDNTINSKDLYNDRSKKAQGLAAEFDNNVSGHTEVLSQEETLIPALTKNTWTVDTTQETTHHVNLNPDISSLGVVAAVTNTTGIGVAAGANLPSADFITTGEIKKEFKNEKTYSWSTPK